MLLAYLVHNLTTNRLARVLDSDSEGEATAAASGRSVASTRPVASGRSVASSRAKASVKAPRKRKPKEANGAADAVKRKASPSGAGTGGPGDCQMCGRKQPDRLHHCQFLSGEALVGTGRVRLCGTCSQLVRSRINDFLSNSGAQKTFQDFTRHVVASGHSQSATAKRLEWCCKQSEPEAASSLWRGRCHGRCMLRVATRLLWP